MEFKVIRRRALHSALGLSVATLGCCAVYAQDDKKDNVTGKLSVDMHGAVHAMVERCYVFEQDSNVSFSFASQYPLAFNVHHHGNSGTEFPVKRESETIYQAEFKSKADHEYCFMWENRIFREAQWVFDLFFTVTPIENSSL